MVASHVRGGVDFPSGEPFGAEAGSEVSFDRPERAWCDVAGMHRDHGLAIAAPPYLVSPVGARIGSQVLGACESAPGPSPP